MEKINLVELLKDCPKGMELDCTMYEDVYFDYVDDLNIIHCYIQHEMHKTSITFNQHGTPNSDIKSKCVIFPKGKTTWEGFQRPFKDGDIIAFDIEEDSQLFIFKEYIHNHDYAKGAKCYMMLDCYGEINFEGDYRVERFATEEEKERLFQAIKNNGYWWNEETKTLEKLIEPKFKIGDGDRIRHKESGNILNYKTINSMDRENFYFEVHCRNASETRGAINWPSDELFRYDDDYSSLLDYFTSYLNDVNGGPHARFKADNNNPYSNPDVEGFEDYLYYEQNGIFIQFKVDNGKITDWVWGDMPNEEYKCLEYNDFKIMIKQDIYKSYSIEKIITSDIIDKYCNKSNINNNKTEDISTKSKPEVNFDILFDYGALISIGGRFIRKSDISAFVREGCDDDEDNYERYFTVVILKNGTKLTFHDIDYEDFVDELDKYYRFKGDIFK